MSSLRGIYLLFQFLLLPLIAVNQEFIGLVSDNFSGNEAARINPSLQNLQKNFISVRALSVGAFAQNDFAYIPHEDITLFGVIFGNDTLPLYDRDWVRYKYYQNENLKSAGFNAYIGGPAIMLSKGDNTFSVHSAFRSYLSAPNIPYEIPVFSTELQGYSPLHHINFNNEPFQIAFLSWNEIGFSWSTKIYQDYANRLDAGITFNGVFAVAGTFINVNKMNYVVIDGHTIHVFDMDLDAGFSLPVNYDNNLIGPQGSPIRGKGLGIDIGFTYTRSARSTHNDKWQRRLSLPYEDYRWRIGISILDIGRVNFNRLAEVHSGYGENVLWGRSDTLETLNIHQLMRDISLVLMGDTNASYKGNSFKMGLPTALSLQFDYHLRSNYYLGSFWVHPLALEKYYVRRSAQLGLIPRFESEWFGASLPLSLYDYKIPRIGAALRFGPLTMGTERLGVLLGLMDINGLDFYMSLNFGFNRKADFRNPVSGGCITDDNFRQRRIKHMRWPEISRKKLSRR
ncbi:MAG: DUF5723 family protein [Bacteroidales bacterium]